MSNDLDIVIMLLNDYDEPVDIQEDNLDQLLKQYETERLPDLVVEPPLWQEKINQLYQTWLEPVFDRLRAWFNGLNKMNNQYQLPWKEIILCVLCVLLLIGLFFVFRYFLRKQRQGISLVSQEGQQPYVRKSLYEAYQHAVQQGQYALAARLFWKYFLQEKNINSSKTPMEYFGPKSEVQSMYTLMFSSSPQQKDFEQFKDVLTRGDDET